jgi:hypothetical protein
MSSDPEDQLEADRHGTESPANSRSPWAWQHTFSVSPSVIAITKHIKAADKGREENTGMGSVPPIECRSAGRQSERQLWPRSSRSQHPDAVVSY